jgi:hypothetical protein
MSITYTDWLDWRQQPVTQAFYEACIERIAESKEVLSISAGLDSTQDNFYRGFIQAYMEMLDFKVEQELPRQEEDDND